MAISSPLNKLWKQSSEFKSWFLVFGCFPRVFIILGLFLLLFWVSLKVLQLSWHGRDFMQLLCDFREKSDNIRAGIWLKTSVVEVCNSKTVQTCRSRRLDWLKKNGLLFSKLNLVANSKWAVDSDGDVRSEEKGEVLEDVQNEEKENNSEDGEFDVVKLRELVKIERKQKKEALEELEKERMAAATAAEEAMSMIFRLQHEKSAIEIRANQFQRMMEQKIQYCQEVIECLQRIVMEYESDGSVSEESCYCSPKQKLQPTEADDGKPFPM